MHIDARHIGGVHVRRAAPAVPELFDARTAREAILACAAVPGEIMSPDWVVLRAHS